MSTVFTDIEQLANKIADQPLTQEEINWLNNAEEVIGVSVNQLSYIHTVLESQEANR